MRLKSAFTMIELVFVIVVLGILAGVAIPKLVVTRDDATVSKLRADIAAIRSGIALQRQQNLMSGNPNWPVLTGGFSEVLQSPIKFKGDARNGWKKTSGTADQPTFEVCVAGKCTNFTYYQKGVVKKGENGKPDTVTTPAGTFSCPPAESVCKMLSE
ncbi:type II secretion system protein [Campylobacter geochelonis]|uniref:N-methylation n=1 Tax=Campylobacter geochelonis TaxID=1780362 RepID=A0A128EK66_9BACT|nr:type II secretion system protein [Campylobacter geochelonis]QKF71665.1 putative type II secretion system protein [Campylobacter geochelonis]CZE49309.1 N-methylation [Campylobacter geochelonis]